VTTTTIGVAIAVPEPWGEQLQTYRAELGDATAQGIPTHVTLMPPFEVDEAAVPAIEQHLAEAAEQNAAFRIHLRGTGTFRPVSPVVFVMLAEGISRCEQLAFSVRRGPLAADLQFPYHPHVTVAHHLADESLDRAFADLATFECDFSVNSFSLYVHDDEAGWVATRDFVLAAPVDG
jgi:2'-5' RNA ligase